MTSKTIYLIRHAESKENRRMQGLKNVGRSLRRCKPPALVDVYNGCKFMGMSALGLTNSVLSRNGMDQIDNMQKILLDVGFTEQVSMVAHSPLIRAKETCFGILDLSGSSAPSVVELQCLCEATPWEMLIPGKRPVRNRIKILEEWITAQAAESIALIGHSEYFSVMLGLDEKFQNCDVWKASYENGLWADVRLAHRLTAITSDADADKRFSS